MSGLNGIIYWIEIIKSIRNEIVYIFADQTFNIKEKKFAWQFNIFTRQILEFEVLSK